MSPKMGRPKTDNPKKHEVMVRFDDDTFEKLNSYCERYGIARTVAIRNGVKMLLEKEEQK